MEEQQIRELVQAYFDRLNGEDWQGLASLFATDAVLRAPGSRTWEGRDEVSAYYRAALAPYPEHRDEPTRVLVAGDTATVEIHFEGRLANGQPLAAGDYQLRITTERPAPAAGQSPAAECWVEFVRGGAVAGREVASVISAEEIGTVAKGPGPKPHAVRVDLLKGGDYLRIWLNSAGTHYIVNLPVWR